MSAPNQPSVVSEEHKKQLIGANSMKPKYLDHEDLIAKVRNIPEDDPQKQSKYDEIKEEAERRHSEKLAKQAPMESTTKENFNSSNMSETSSESSASASATDSTKQESTVEKIKSVECTDGTCKRTEVKKEKSTKCCDCENCTCGDDCKCTKDNCVCPKQDSTN